MCNSRSVDSPETGGAGAERPRWAQADEGHPCPRLVARVQAKPLRTSLRSASLHKPRPAGASFDKTRQSVALWLGNYLPRSRDLERLVCCLGLQSCGRHVTGGPGARPSSRMSRRSPRRVVSRRPRPRNSPTTAMTNAAQGGPRNSQSASRTSPTAGPTRGGAAPPTPAPARSRFASLKSVSTAA